ncbi:MAG: hypothetical protein ACXVWZ_11100, partial [Nocardioides sp.]
TPQAQQGYHVKLTVATPRSKGNDTKTKVFWVAPCDTTGTGGDTTGGGTTGGGTTGGGGDTGTTGTGTTGGTTGTGETQDQSSGDIEVMGAQASTGPNGSADTAGAQASNGVPTAVDAGAEGNPVLNLVRSPLPLLGIALGLGLIVAFVIRRRSAHSLR